MYSKIGSKGSASNSSSFGNSDNGGAATTHQNDEMLPTTEVSEPITYV